jgi:hypothetical protein
LASKTVFIGLLWNAFFAASPIFCCFAASKLLSTMSYSVLLIFSVRLDSALHGGAVIVNDIDEDEMGRALATDARAEYSLSTCQS